MIANAVEGETSSSPLPYDCDVAVVGAGPAGSATARWLAQAGCRVVLLERSNFDEPRVGESLAPGVQPLLRKLGVWPEFLASAPLPSHGTKSVWGGADVEKYAHLMSPWGSGWHVDRLAFDRMLAQSARAAGAVLRTGVVPVRCDRLADDWLLTLQSGDGRAGLELRAHMLVDATGRGARLARWMGARRFLFDRLVSVVGALDGIDTAQQGYVMVESISDGWWYTAPVPDGRMMTMLMTDADLCGRTRLTSEGEWRRRMREAQATLARTDAGTPSWGPMVFSSVSQRLLRRERSAPWLGVGDAALSVDPISGSGVVRALRTARAAADTALALLVGTAHDAIEAYEVSRDGECGAYLNERAQYYGMEKRWQTSPFWQRRLFDS